MGALTWRREDGPDGSAAMICVEQPAYCYGLGKPAGPVPKLPATEEELSATPRRPPAAPRRPTVRPATNLRGDLANRYGVDVGMLEFALDPANTRESIRADIERRIAAGNESAKIMKLTLNHMGMWWDPPPTDRGGSAGSPGPGSGPPGA